MTSVEEAFGWLSYAEDTLQEAKDTLAIGKYGVAVSLSYYACFYAAKSILSYSRERDPKTHSGVISRFGELAVRGSDFPSEVARFLAYLAEQRGRTDYDLGYREKWRSDNAAPLLGMSETFVAEVRAWFARHHGHDPELDR
ncbi:MAG: HEPN domain-containing protein [bacterium]|nr:HEPN domain-containing protein [bacterium]